MSQSCQIERLLPNCVLEWSGTQFRTSFHPHLAISPLLSLKLSNLGPKVQK